MNVAIVSAMGKGAQQRPIGFGRLSFVLLLGLLVGLLSGCADRAQPSGPGGSTDGTPQVFDVRGVVKSLAADGRSVVVAHEAIPGYMAAMTMPFRLKAGSELSGVKAGDSIRFRLHVTEDESWIEAVNVLTGGSGRDVARGPAETAPARSSAPTNSPSARSTHPLMDYKFTNQLGQPVSLSDFRGRALGITFIFTRCPVPDYCPRLTKNFQETVRKLSSLPDTPTNWHLLSFTIDPAFDTPKILKGYAQRYDYDPAKWSFLTGPPEKVSELVRESGVTVTPEAGLFNHNMRTLIVGTNGQLLVSIPVGGPISDAIVAELRKAMGATNSP